MRGALVVLIVCNPLPWYIAARGMTDPRIAFGLGLCSCIVQTVLASLLSRMTK